METLENAAVLLGLINIILVVRRSLWNYPFGIAMVALYFFIFAAEKLYSDALLQVFFLVVQLYGWWYWLQSRDAEGEVIVRSMNIGSLLLWLLGMTAATLAWGWLMHRYTDAASPWWDAAVAMISVGAQILLSRRYIENWPLWMLVDAVAMGLYHSKGLEKTAILYGIFLLVALWGWREWLKVGQAQRMTGTPATA